MSTCVQTHVAGLSDSYRAVLLLHDEEGLSAREIAELLRPDAGGVSLGSGRSSHQ